MAADPKSGDVYCDWCKALVAVMDAGNKPVVLVPYVTEREQVLCLKDFDMLKRLSRFVANRKPIHD